MALITDQTKGGVPQSDIQGTGEESTPRMNIIKELLGGFEAERDEIREALQEVKDPTAAAEEAEAAAETEFEAERPALNKKQVLLHALANAMMSYGSDDPGVTGARLVQQFTQNRIARIEAKRRAGEEAAAKAETRVIREQEKLERKEENIEDLIRRTELFETEQAISVLDERQRRKEFLEDREAQQVWDMRTMNYEHWLTMHEKKFDAMTQRERDAANFTRQKKLEDIRSKNRIAENAIASGRIDARQLRQEYIGMGLNPDDAQRVAQFVVRNSNSELPADLDAVVVEAKKMDATSPRFRNMVRSNIIQSWGKTAGNNFELVVDEEGNEQWIKLTPAQDIDRLFGLLQGYDRHAERVLTGVDPDPLPDEVKQASMANMDTALSYARRLTENLRMAETPGEIQAAENAVMTFEKEVMNETRIPPEQKEMFLQKFQQMMQQAQGEVAESQGGVATRSAVDVMLKKMGNMPGVGRTAVGATLQTILGGEESE